MNSAAQKGPFWVIGILTDNEQDTCGDAKLIAYPVGQEVVPVPSHKEVWPCVKGTRNVPWNYYPRGRVEIRNGKAIIFANSICFAYSEIEKEVIKAFSLGGMETVFKVDNSAHYSEGVYQARSCKYAKKYRCRQIRGKAVNEKGQKMRQRERKGRDVK